MFISNKRLNFLIDKFNVVEELSLTSEESTDENIIPIYSKKNSDLLLAKLILNNKKIFINRFVFEQMLDNDKTHNKVHLQWMLNIFVRLLKGSSKEHSKAIMLVDDDLPMASDYLTIFELNKNKDKFKRLVNGNHSLKHILTPNDLYQYKTLSELYDAVDPFIEKNSSQMENLINKFVEIGEATIPVMDRNYMVYIPKTRDASVIFAPFVNWCTAKPNNGNFNNYKSNYKKPNYEKSDIFIIIDKKFFTGESDNLYQIHFESNQVKDKRNDNNIDFFSEVLSKSEALLFYFKDYLYPLYKQINKPFNANIYAKFLINFGVSDILFENYDENTMAIEFIDEEYKIFILPDISHLKNLFSLTLSGVLLTEINNSISKLNNLTILSFYNNNLTSLPNEISELKNLASLNLSKNKITKLPESFKKLDKENGGSLEFIATDNQDLAKQIKNIIPNAKILLT